MTVENVRALCPGRDEIIIATAIDRKDYHMQAWEIRASRLLQHRRLKG